MSTTTMINTGEVTDGQSRAKIKCGNTGAHKYNAPTAVFCCIKCEKYLCDKCNGSVHQSNKHASVPISKLKSYVVFSGNTPSNESHVRRNLRAQAGPEKWVWKQNGCSTLYECFMRSVKLSPNSELLGQRQLNSDGSVGAYKWLTYGQVQERVNKFSAGLVELGAKAGDRIGLYSINRPEWVIAEYACYCQSMVPVPLYDTLGHDAAQHVITQAGLKIVVTSMDKLDNCVDIAKQFDGLKYIIAMPRQPFDPKSMPGQQHVGQTFAQCKVLTYESVESNGAQHPHQHNPPKPDDLFTLSYTSGTTGQSKGAMLTHRNIIGNCAAIETHNDDAIKFVSGDKHISYLPLAHMFERTTVSNMIAQGGGIGFFRGDPLKLLEDMEMLKPTGFPIVPRLANRIYDAILGQVNAAGGIKARLFHHAYSVKLHNWNKHKQLTHVVWDRLVFGKVANKIGGRVRLMVTGSAPISDDVKNFMRLVFSAPVFEGYGQTEANAGVTIDSDGIGCVGTPLPCNEIKLVDVPEMKYLHSDTTNNQYTPRGEVCARGVNRFRGYWNDKEKTAEALDDEGWLHSGDIGRWNPDGTLSIIDRKKNIFKLSQGEYIAPEKIENVYARSKYVAQSFVYGDSMQSDLVAIIVPDFEVLNAYAKSHSLPTDPKQLVEDKKVREMILKDIVKAGKQGRLQSFEQVKAIRLYHELFSVENDILTPTQKLKRPYAKDKFQKHLDEMYSDLKGAKPVSKL